MDWVWSRATPTGTDWFIIRLRRSDGFPADQRVSLTLIDRPHDGPEDATRSVLATLDDALEVTGPLTQELRADGWERAKSGLASVPAA